MIDFGQGQLGALLSQSLQFVVAVQNILPPILIFKVPLDRLSQANL